MLHECLSLILNTIYILCMQQIPQLGHLESDSSDDGLDPMLEGSRGPGSHEKDRELVSALLNEAFAMVTPTPQRFVHLW